MEKERRIEKLLRAFAKKRKADAGALLELHPATRRLLQDEVARGAKRTAREKPSLWKILFGTTPRRAFAVCALITLVVNALIFLPTLKRSSPKLALVAGKSEATKKFAEAESTAPALQPAPPPASPPVATVMPAQEAFAGRKDVGLKTDGNYALSDLPAANGNAQALDVDKLSSTNANLAFALNKTPGEVPQTFGPGMDDGRFKYTVTAETATTSGYLAGNRGGGGGAGGFGGDAIGATGGERLLLDDAKTSMSLVSTNFYAKAETRSWDADKSGSQNQIVMQRFYRMRAVDELEGAKEKSRDRQQLGMAQQKPGAGEVLDSFAVEQDGNQLTVVDSDGSRYSGTVQLASVQNEDLSAAKQRTVSFDSSVQTTAARRAIAPATVAGSVAPSGSATAVHGAVAAQNYSFQVIGTNLSSNQRVVFSGNFVAITNNLIVAGASMSNFISGFGLQTNGPESLLQNSRIVGRAIVGPKSQIEINAAPVAP